MVICTNVSTTQITRPPPCGIIGDIDGDGNITQLDIDLAFAWLDLPTLTPDQLKRIDVNGNGRADFDDVNLIGQYIREEITTFPACTLPILSLTNISFIKNNCSEFNSCTPNIIDAPLTDYVTIQAIVTINNANAKFKLKIDYKLNGTQKSFITSEITQNMGTTIQCISINETWIIGNYTELIITAIDVFNA